MTRKAGPLCDRYELRWPDRHVETVVHIRLHEDESLTIREEGTMLDPVSGEVEPWQEDLVAVPASQVDQFVEAVLLIQLRGKEHRGGQRGPI